MIGPDGLDNRHGIQGEREMSKFWDKVSKCEHKNHTNYYEDIYCSTPYCRGSEIRCVDCKVYISSCPCHYNDGMSGWSKWRWIANDKK